LRSRQGALVSGSVTSESVQSATIAMTSGPNIAPISSSFGSPPQSSGTSCSAPAMICSSVPP
jgi:hypothetical protein